MPRLENISVHIVVDGTVLKEYDNPARHRDEPNSISKYVETVSEAKFSIFVNVPPHHPFQGDTLCFRVYVDSKLTGEIWHREPATSPNTKTEEDDDESPGTNKGGAIQGYITADKEKEDLMRFPHVMLSDNPSPYADEEEDKQYWDKREIVVQVSHARLVYDPKGFENARTLGNEVERLQDDDSILAFTFMPRPKKLLRAILNLPPSPKSGKPADFVTRPGEVPNPNLSPADLANWKLVNSKKNKQLYCYCRLMTQKGDRVVTCDNDDCPITNFHWKCVSLYAEPRDFWFCPDCRELSAEERSVRGKVDPV